MKHKILLPIACILVQSVVATIPALTIDTLPCTGEDHDTIAYDTFANNLLNTTFVPLERRTCVGIVGILEELGLMISDDGCVYNVATPKQQLQTASQLQRRAEAQGKLNSQPRSQ